MRRRRRLQGDAIRTLAKPALDAYVASIDDPDATVEATSHDRPFSHRNYRDIAASQQPGPDRSLTKIARVMIACVRHG
jgi:hypothetical protein